MKRENRKSAIEKMYDKYLRIFHMKYECVSISMVLNDLRQLQLQLKQVTNETK